MDRQKARSIANKCTNLFYFTFILQQKEFDEVGLFVLSSSALDAIFFFVWKKFHYFLTNMLNIKG